MKYYKPTIAIILILVFTFTFSSCEKIKDLSSFDISYPVPKIHFSLDSTTYQPKAEMLLYQRSMDINIDSIINTHKLDGIENAKFESVLLQIETAGTHRATFGWLASGRITVSAKDLNETEVASISEVPANARSIEMEVTNADITSIVKKGSFMLKIYGSIAPPLPIETLDLTLKSNIKMRVAPL